jgi:hypothetical protein
MSERATHQGETKLEIGNTETKLLVKNLALANAKFYRFPYRLINNYRL